MVSLADNKMGRMVDKEKMKSKQASLDEIKEMEKRLKRKPPRLKVPKLIDFTLKKKFNFKCNLEAEWENSEIAEEMESEIGDWISRVVPLDVDIEYTVELKWKKKTYVKERRAEVCDGTKSNYHKRR